VALVAVAVPLAIAAAAAARQLAVRATGGSR
jgi:hypothetical protein